MRQHRVFTSHKALKVLIQRVFNREPGAGVCVEVNRRLRRETPNTTATATAGVASLRNEVI